MKIYVEPAPNETKIEYMKRRAGVRLQACKDWVHRNRQAIAIVTPVMIGGIATIAKVAGKQMNLRKEEAIKNLYCYDNQLGHYWALKRKLSNSEWLEVDARKRAGERLGDILNELRVLK